MKLSVAAATIALQATQVAAAPVQEAVSVAPRQDAKIIWEGDGGVSYAAIGDGKMRYGHLVPSSTLDIIAEECNQLNCAAGATFEHNALFVNSDRGVEGKIKMTVDGDFNGKGDLGGRDQLLSLAKSAMEEVYNSGVATREQGVMYITGECPPNQVHGCLTQESDYTDQWVSTDHVSIHVYNDDGAQMGTLNISWEHADDEGSGVCAAMSAASAGIGLVNAFASAGTSLASIFCDQISA